MRQALGGTVNDVVLCAATGALRELLLERGEDPPHQGLRAMVPVNIRREGDRGELGNKVSSLFVELPREHGGADTEIVALGARRWPEDSTRSGPGASTAAWPGRRR